MKATVLVILGFIALLVGALMIHPDPIDAHSFTMTREVAIQDLECLGESLENYAADHAGAYPADLDALLDQGDDDGDAGDVLDRTMLFPDPRKRPNTDDPWKRPYIYEQKSDGRGWRLSSLGSDGKPGGSGDARDLSLESK
jgi:general secretion pathway protein G